MKRATLILAALVLLFGGNQASAGLITSGTPGGGDVTLGPDPLIIFSYNDGTNTATGTLSSIPLGLGLFLATGGALTVTGPAAGSYSIVPGGPAFFGIPGFNVDNVITPSADPILDVFGLALFDGGTTYLNIWGNSPGNYSFWTFDTPSAQYPVQSTGAAVVTANVVPEPGTLLLLGAGLTVLAGTVRRRRRRA